MKSHYNHLEVKNGRIGVNHYWICRCRTIYRNPLLHEFPMICRICKNSYVWSRRPHPKEMLEYLRRERAKLPASKMSGQMLVTSHKVTAFDEEWSEIIQECEEWIRDHEN